MNDANGCRVVGVAIADVVGRVALLLCLGGALSACAESVHQTERLSTRDFMLDPGMPVSSPMPTGLGRCLPRAMGSATVQGIGAIRSGTMGFRMGRTGRRASDGMADMEVSVRHVHRLVCLALGHPCLPIRHRGLEKATEWSARSTWRICFWFSLAKRGSDGGSAVLGWSNGWFG